MIGRLLLLAAVVAGFAPVPAAAQGVVPAQAVVVTIGMTMVSLRDLDFGTVPKGVATTVQPTAATAGAWQTTGNPNALVLITFTLPTVLTNIQAAPGSTIPITFANNSARYRRSNSDPTGGTAINPAGTSLTLFGGAANPTLYVWIGGTVTPAAAAKPGIYRGTVILSLDYLF